MTRRAVDLLRHLDDVQVHPGAQLSAFDALEASCGLVLPSDHKELLRWSNGLEAYAGHFRIFGLGADAGIDSMVWNHYECWKFAWRERCSQYWCFGETAWGEDRKSVV